jgi:cation:H+ antiporter
VRGSAALAARLGVTPLVIGLTVVAFGTSMPELVVSARSALEGSAALAAGNVVGSNIGNIALILGICAVIRPLGVQARIIRIDLPLLLGVSVLLLLLLGDDRLGRLEGGLLLAGLVGYTIFSLRAAPRESAAVQAEFAAGAPAAPRNVILNLAFIAGGLLLLVIGARLLVEGATFIARGAGVREAVIGLTVVAVGTSLPELATSVLASTRGEGDIAIGNVVGSNLFNILGILGVAALVRPLVGTGMSVLDLGVMMGATVVLLPLAWTGFRIGRLEGILLLTGYATYLALLALG